MTALLIALAAVSGWVYVNGQDEYQTRGERYARMVDGTQGDIQWINTLMLTDPALVGVRFNRPADGGVQAGMIGDNARPGDIEVRELTNRGPVAFRFDPAPARRRSFGILVLLWSMALLAYAAATLGRPRESAVRRRSYEASLEALVERRTEDLRTALRETRDADLAKSRFLATMSHEIRTPLNAVLGLAEALSDRVRDPEARRLSHVIVDSAQGLLALLNNVLDFSKGAAGELHLTAEPVDLDGLLLSVTGMLRQVAADKGLELISELDPDLPSHALSDGLHLRQLLTNLAANAVRYTDTGHVKVWMSKIESVKGDQLELGVQDTGPGISQAAQQRIFDPFVQAEDRSDIGTGLGLAICRQIVLSLQGEIDVQSELGAGTTFRIRIPLTAVEADAPTTASEPPALTPLRVLVVEDNPVNRMVVVELLRGTGHEVLTAGTGLEALDVLAAQTPDLILMDCQMPGLDGYGATRRIRAGEVGPEAAVLPIIALTAHALPEDRRRCEDAGMDDYATKPVSRSTLLGILHKYGIRRPMSDEPMAQASPQLDEMVALLGPDAVVSLADSIEGLLHNIESALEASDVERIAFVGHTLKGSSAQLGFEALSKAAATLEREAKQGRVWPEHPRVQAEGRAAVETMRSLATPA